jgi:hypothetical protein
MNEATRLTEVIDQTNDEFTSGVKERLRDLPALPEQTLEWLTMEHYQFSFANAGLLQSAVTSTERLSDKGVSAELRRNLEEEDGHAPMYKRGMLEIGTDFDARADFAPTAEFLSALAELASTSPSRALGALYATETAAIFEHEVFFDICHELCERRGVQWEGSTIKAFHDIHLAEGVEQGHKDGLAVFVDGPNTDSSGEKPINRQDVLAGANEAIDVMRAWWRALLAHAGIPEAGPDRGSAPA